MNFALDLVDQHHIHNDLQWFTSEALTTSYAQVQHGFFARTGGVSTGPYASLNCGWNRGEAAHVQENYIRIGQIFQVDPMSSVLRLNQTHSTNVIVVDEPWSMHERPSGDGLVTKKTGLVIGVITADCVPLLLLDPEGPVIGAIHVGWRGAAQGMIDVALRTMRGQGARFERIDAVIGPAIQQSSYEVGREVYEHFSLGIQYHCFKPSRPDHFMFDLPGAVMHLLREYPLRTVHSCALDTYALSDLFFSCRRAAHQDQPFGNQFSGIMIRA